MAKRAFPLSILMIKFSFVTLNMIFLKLERNQRDVFLLSVSIPQTDEKIKTILKKFGLTKFKKEDERIIFWKNLESKNLIGFLKRLKASIIAYKMKKWYKYYGRIFLGRKI